MDLSTEHIRAFIAVDMPDEVVKEVARVQEVLSGKKFTGKMTELENLHLTLKFLGEIKESHIEEVKNRLATARFNPFEAKLSEIGTFGYQGSPRIVWIKIGGKGIFELQQQVDAVLDGLFAKEERFMSHMTIARVRYVADRQGFMEHVRRLGVKDVRWNVDRFFLKKSELRPSGPIYTTIGEFSAS